MTIIIGLKQNGNIWIGSDSLVTDIDTCVDPANLVNNNKILPFKNGFIGCAGDISARNLLELFFGIPENYDLEINTTNDALKFTISFRRFVKEAMHPTSDLTNPDTGKLIGADLDLLIATKNKIFSIDSDGAILEYGNFFCIGRGGEMGMGILDYLTTKTHLSPEEKIKEVCDIVSKYHFSCGGPTIIKNVTKELNPKSSKKKM